MITNKDLSIDSENGKITLNGNKYDLGTQGEIDTAVKDVYSVIGQLGAKNLIPYPYYETTKTVNGVTFTDNGDGTITVSGTASADAIFGVRNVWSASELVELLPNTIYAFSGCPVGGSISTYLIQFVNEESDMSNKSWYDDIGTGGTLTTTDVKRFVGSRIVIKSGAAFSTPVTFKPMLRLAADTDNTYEPYAMTNKQLTEQVADVKGTIGDLTQTGVTGADVAAQITALDAALTAHDNTTVQQLNIFKSGNMVYIYGYINNLSSSDTVIAYATLDEKYKPASNYAIGTFISATAPYLPVGSVWISKSAGAVHIYKDAATTEGYVCLAYMA